MLHPPPLGLQYDVRVSYSDIGRTLGVDEETVRSRVKRLQEEGILTGWNIAVNPAVLGRTMVRFDVPAVDLAAREKVRAGLAALDGAMWLFEYHSGTNAVVLFLSPGAAVQRTAALIAAFAGPPVQTASLSPAPPGLEPTALDWRIIQALRRDPRKPFAALAAEVGVSERTVRRRLEALTDGRVLILNADVDTTRIRGGIPVSILVEQPPGPARAEAERLLGALPGRMFHAADERGIRTSMLAASVADLEPLQTRLAALPGVRRVSVEFQIRRLSVGAWLDDEIARRAAAAAR